MISNVDSRHVDEQEPQALMTRSGVAQARESFLDGSRAATGELARAGFWMQTSKSLGILTKFLTFSMAV